MKYPGGAVRPIMCCCRLQSCCCCGLREGSIAVGIIDLILSALGLALGVWPIAASGGAVQVNPYSYGTLGVYAISILFSILLILGAVKNNACLCLAWIIWSSICLVLNIALVGWICVVAWGVNLGASAAAAAGSAFAAALGIVAVSLYIALAILGVIIFFLIYGIIVVNSFRQELNESGGNPAGSYPMQAV
ncbi:uncharacterized protein LOC144924802 [Branchiostoma floridae x Branchiostoma belcheri]